MEGYSPDVVQLCYSSNELAKVNPRSPMGGQSTAESALGEALCVEKKNFAYQVRKKYLPFDCINTFV